MFASHALCSFLLAIGLSCGLQVERVGAKARLNDDPITYFVNQHSSAVASHEADPATGVDCPHGDPFGTGINRWADTSQKHSVGGCAQYEKDFAIRARNNRLRGYISGSYDPLEWGKRMDPGPNAGMVIDGGPDCKACASLLTGSGIMAADMNLDKMKTRYIRWKGEQGNREMQEVSDADGNAKRHHYDTSECFKAFMMLDCDMKE